MNQNISGSLPLLEKPLGQAPNYTLRPSYPRNRVSGFKIHNFIEFRSLTPFLYTPTSRHEASTAADVQGCGSYVPLGFIAQRQ
jgi:hypothetical protein